MGTISKNSQLETMRTAMKKYASIFATIAFVVALYGAAIYLLFTNGWKFQQSVPEYDLPDIHIKGE